MEAATQYMMWYKKHPGAGVMVYLKEGHIQADKHEELLYQDTAFRGYADPAAMCRAADYTD